MSLSFIDLYAYSCLAKFQQYMYGGRPLGEDHVLQQYADQAC